MIQGKNHQRSTCITKKAKRTVSGTCSGLSMGTENNSKTYVCWQSENRWMKFSIIDGQTV